MSETIDPCPFCAEDGQPFIQPYSNGRNERSFMIQCKICRSGTGRTRASEREAIHDWNVWPRWRRAQAGLKNIQERRILDDRIHHQRRRLRYWEETLNDHVHGHLHALKPRHLKKAIELDNENHRLRTALSEVEQRARSEALEEAAKVARHYNAKPLDGEQDVWWWQSKAAVDIATAIRALIPSESHDAEGRE